MKLYFGKFSGQMEKHYFKWSKLLANLVKYARIDLVYCLGHIWSYKLNAAVIQVGLETRHLKILNHIW